MNIIDEQKFTCKYTVKFWCNSWRHNYEVICNKGAINFHWVDYLDRKDIPDNAGLEIHYRIPPEYMEDRAPTHIDCQLTGGWCWHDGTSLYATETLLPMIKDATPEEALNVLCSECSDRFKLEGEGDE